MTISQPDLLTAAEEALDAMQSYMGSSNLGPRVMLLDEREPIEWAVWFATVHCGTPPQRFRRLVPVGNGSWLMRVLGRSGVMPTVAVNSSQIKKWAKDHVHPDLQFCEALLTARCMYHEVGHVKMHGYLLARRSPGTLAVSASPAEEEQAWVFCFIILGMMIGDYARSQRRSHNMDDSPTRLV